MHITLTRGKKPEKDGKKEKSQTTKTNDKSPTKENNKKPPVIKHIILLNDKMYLILSTAKRLPASRENI